MNEKVYHGTLPIIIPKQLNYTPSKIIMDDIARCGKNQEKAKQELMDWNAKRDSIRNSLNDQLDEQSRLEQAKRDSLQATALGNKPSQSVSELKTELARIAADIEDSKTMIGFIDDEVEKAEIRTRHVRDEIESLKLNLLNEAQRVLTEKIDSTLLILYELWFCETSLVNPDRHRFYFPEQFIAFVKDNFLSAGNLSSQQGLIDTCDRRIKKAFYEGGLE